MILITGGGGALGAAINTDLTKTGFQNVALTREVCDISDAEQVMEAFNEHKPDIVINCAAMTGVDLCEYRPGDALLANSVGAGIVATAAEAAGAYLIHISTDYVFRGDAGPYAVGSIPYPTTQYGVSKYFGEQAVRRLHTNALIVRLGWLYGPEYPNCAPELAKKHGTTNVTIWSDIKGTPTLLSDAAERISLEASSSALGFGRIEGEDVVHLAPWREPISWYDMLKWDYPNIKAAKSPFNVNRPRLGGLIPSDGWHVG